MFYTHAIDVHSAHVVEQALELASAVGGKHLHYVPPALPVDAAAEIWADEVVKRQTMGSFVLLHPGAGWGAKQWPAELYGEVAAELAEQHITPLVPHGVTERALAHEVARLSDHDATPVECSISELIALTRRAKLVIGGDTGPLHLAAALEIPVIALFRPTDPRRTGPFGTREEVLRSAASRTSHVRRDATETGLLSITAEEVITAARSLLEERA